MWTMAYFRKLPVPIREIEPEFLEIFFNFANTYTEESVLQGYAKQRKEEESKPTVEKMKRLGYSYNDIAGMDL
jgi:hypothetical protein